MKNELFSIGPFTFYGYGLMIAIGIVAAYLMAEYRAKRKSLDPDQIFNFLVFGLIGGFVGAKILFLITDMKRIMEDPSIFFSLTEGWVVYGGLIGGIAAGFLYARVKKLNVYSYFDVIFPSIALAQGFGRIGCQFAGCCYGHETDGFLHTTFQYSAYAPNGIPLIPTQLISSFLNFGHFFVLIWFAGRKKAEGQVASLYVILYSIGRFIIEFFRGDLERGSVGSLSTSQFISIFTLLAGIAAFVYCTKKNPVAAVSQSDAQPEAQSPAEEETASKTEE